MNHDLVVAFLFLMVAAAHHWLEKHFEGKHYHLHWLAFAVHPITFIAAKDWLVHLLVYSKYALLGAH